MPRKPAIYEELMQVPDTKVAEILDGELVVCPRPASRHALASSELGVEISGRFGKARAGRAGWWILDEPEVHFGDDVIVPDLAGWRCERMPEYPDTAAFHLAPDWVCEVLSPSTETIDRVRKLPIYAVAGVKHAWLVNPIARMLEVLRLEQGKWLLLGTYADDAMVRAEPFDSAEIDLLPLWGGSRRE